DRQQLNRYRTDPNSPCAAADHSRDCSRGSSCHEATLLLKGVGRAHFRSKLPRSDTVGRLPVTLGFTWTVHIFRTISRRPTSPCAFGAESCRGSRLPIR